MAEDNALLNVTQRTTYPEFIKSISSSEHTDDLIKKSLKSAIQNKKSKACYFILKKFGDRLSLDNEEIKALINLSIENDSIRLYEMLFMHDYIGQLIKTDPKYDLRDIIAKN
jgi:hypothetical protein